jgi:quercetin dioxygenase-like cupin family protein
MTMHNTTLQPYFLQTDEGQAVWFLTSRMTVKASSKSTDGALMVIEVLQAPGGAAPWHVHHREDEMFYVLEGTVLFKVGDELHQGNAGAFIFLPRDIPHSYKNIGGTDARWLLLTTPAGAESFFIEAGIPAVEDGIRPQPVDPRKFAEIAAKYGLEILGPPPF